MIPNAFHQNFYLKNTLSLRIIRKNDVHSNGTNIFFAFRSKNISTGITQSFSNEKISDVQAVFGLLKEFRNCLEIYEKREE